MRRGAIVVGCVVCAAACGKTTSTSPSSSSSSSLAPKTTMTCDEIFAPNGDLLCDEHVAPSTGVKDEIHWRSYGLREVRMVYCDHYLDAARACNFGFTFKPPLCDVDDNKGRRAEIFFNDRGTADYPKCGKAPDAQHRTVLVISEKHSP